MPNPRPDLQGWAAKSEPGWEQRALERVKARQKAYNRPSKRTNGLFVTYDDPIRILLDEACRRRDISQSGYIRRAFIAFLAWDLGLVPEEIAQHSAQPRNYHKNVGDNKRTKDNMRGHGIWRILKLGQ